MTENNDTWRKASYSNGSGNCVEVGNQAGGVAVRDTENRDGATLSLPAEAWQAFTDNLK